MYINQNKFDTFRSKSVEECTTSETNNVLLGHLGHILLCCTPFYNDSIKL